MRKKVLSVIICLIVVGILLMGCGSEKQTITGDTTPNGTIKEEDMDNEDVATYKIGVLMSANSDTFIQKITEGIKAQADTYDNVEIYVQDAEGDTEKMISQAESVVAQDVDVMIANVVDAEGCNPIVELCNDAGIPLVLCNRLTTNENYTAYVGSDDIEAGKIQAEYVKSVLPEGSKITIMYGPMGISPQINRALGYEEAGIIDGAYEILQDQTANWKRDEALNLAEDWLTRYPDLDGIICQNDDMAMGALEAVEAAGKLESVKVFGIDAIEDAVKAVADGRLTSTVYQDATGQGAKAVDLAVELAKGNTVDKENLIPFLLVTQDNVAEFQ